MMLSVIIVALLLAGWTSAWLNWIFNGEIRQFMIAKFFPTAWLGGRDRVDIQYMNQEEIVTFLCGSSSAPEFIRGVLSCPLCLSAHIAGVGALFAARAVYTFSGGLWELVPLVWASAAVFGYLRVKKEI